MSGGFTIYELSRESDGFVRTEWRAGDLSYDKGEYITDPPWGFRYPSFRPSVQVCYDNSFELLKRGNERAGLKLSYAPNKYTEIKDFPFGFHYSYHYIDQSGHPSEGYLSSSATGKVYTPAWSVEYYQTKKYYFTNTNSYSLSSENQIFIWLSTIVSLWNVKQYPVVNRIPLRLRTAVFPVRQFKMRKISRLETSTSPLKSYIKY